LQGGQQGQFQQNQLQQGQFQQSQFPLNLNKFGQFQQGQFQPGQQGQFQPGNFRLGNGAGQSNLNPQQQAALLQSSPEYLAFQRSLNSINYFNDPIFQKAPPQNLVPPGKLNGVSVNLSGADTAAISNLATVTPNSCTALQPQSLSVPANRLTMINTDLSGLSK
jgi:hypothetical protein